MEHAVKNLLTKKTMGPYHFTHKDYNTFKVEKRICVNS